MVVSNLIGNGWQKRLNRPSELGANEMIKIIGYATLK